MQIHEGTGISHHPLLGINESLGKLNAVVDVVAASAPVKSALFVGGLAALVTVTATDLQVSLTTCSGDGVH